MLSSISQKARKILSGVDWAKVVQDALPMIVATLFLTMLAAFGRLMLGA